jgi:hypothetical protein
LKSAVKHKSDSIEEFNIKSQQLEGANRRLAQEVEELSGLKGEGTVCSDCYYCKLIKFFKSVKISFYFVLELYIF